MKRTSTWFLVTLFVVGLAGVVVGQQKGRGGRGGFGFGGFGGGGTLLTLAANESVQKELGLSGDIAGKLTALRDDYRAAQVKEYQTAGIDPQDFQNITAELRQKMTAVGRKLNDEFNPKVKELVGADSYKRLEQIELQWNLQNRGPGALTYSHIAAELKLTDDQTKKLNDLQTALDAKQRELFSGGGFDRDAFAKLREERNEKTMALLTAEQKDKLKSLQGSPFDVSQIGFGFGRRGKGN